MESGKTPDFHRVDLETAAALGCAKCALEHETGEKTTKEHGDRCPRKRQGKGKGGRPFRPNHQHSTTTAAVAAASSAGAKSVASSAGAGAAGAAGKKRPPASAAAASAGGTKRKRAQDAAAADEGGKKKEGAAGDDGGARKGVAKGGGGDGEGGEGDDDDDDGGDLSSSAAAAAPTRVGNFVDFPVSNLRSHLVCSLCRGYFRDPHTVADCLHTFCRSCLILFFRQGMRCCPTCNTRLGPDPFHTSISIQSREVIPDRTLQEVIEKIFPWMKAREEEEEREFYARRGIESKPEYAQEGAASPVKERRGQGRGGGGSGGGEKVSATMMDDLLDLSLEPDGRPPNARQRLPPLRGSLLRTSGRLKISSLKKYLAQRLGMRERKNSIELLCNGDPMGDELSLTFILRTRWFSTSRVLTLKYRLEEEDK